MATARRAGRTRSISEGVEGGDVEGVEVAGVGGVTTVRRWTVATAAMRVSLHEGCLSGRA